MDKNIDELLKAALTPDAAPQASLNIQVLMKAKERTNMVNRKRFRAAAVTAAATLLLGSLTAFAAYKYLNPSQVASELEDTALQSAFTGEDAVFVNENQEMNGYRITLLGSVAGTDISDFVAYDNGIALDDRIYTVVAIEHTDGTPMPDTSSDEYGNEPFYVSCYVKGLDPKVYSIASMHGNYSAFVKDGIEYRLMEMDNIEMFADKGIYVGANSGSFYDVNAYIYNENTGEMTRNADYDGVNALFTLPIDPAKADPAAAAAYLEEFEKEMNGSDEENVPKEDLAKTEEDIFMEKLTPENLDEYAAPVEDTKMVCTPDADGMISYNWKLEDGAGSEGAKIRVDWIFPDLKPATVIGGYSSSGSLDTLNIEVFKLKEDGTVEFAVYKPIIQ